MPNNVYNNSMHKILIIINSFSYSQSTDYKVRRISSILSEYGFNVDIKDNISLLSIFNEGSPALELKDKYEFAFFLDKDKYLSSMLETYFPIINSSESIESADDKMLTYLKIMNNGIKTPLTISAPLNYNNDYSQEKALKFLKKVENKITFPIIVKKVYGSLGKQVYLAKNHDELLSLYKQLAYIPHIYQEYIGYEYGTDYRLFTIGHKVVAAMKRTNNNDFRSNIALGGKGTNFNPPKSFIDMAEKASKILDLDYAGVDLIKGKNGEPIFNEINSNAFFTEIEKASGIDITRQLILYVLKKFKLL